MRVFVAGASGAIGRALVPKLIEAGHEVVGTTRSEEKAAAIRAGGAEAVVVDLLDPAALTRTVHEAEPEVVINQLTSLPDVIDPRDKQALVATNRLRGEVGPVLSQLAADAGARRLISQSVAFFYGPGAGLASESDPLLDPPPSSFLFEAAAALKSLERATLDTPGLDGLVLRYGYFYGKRAFYGVEGGMAEQVRRRRFPLIGDGGGVYSFIQIDDAAAATAAAVDGGAPGAYNVCDDEPAPQREWLPAYAEAIGAKPPRRVPVWLAKLVVGASAVAAATRLRGADSKFKRELGWQPGFPSWRQGFRESLR